VTYILVSLLLVGATIVIHGVGTTLWLQHLVNHHMAGARLSNQTRMWQLILTALVLTGLHIIEILLWAVAYLVMAPGELPSLEAAVYFSAVTFTTVGYGDITLGEGRLMSGLEAIDGILLVGWSTAFIFSVLQRSWGSLLTEHKTQGDSE
jgi:hypothetical protein